MKMYRKLIILLVGMMVSVRVCKATSPRIPLVYYVIENQTGEMLCADVKYTDAFTENCLNAYPYSLMTLYGLLDGETSVWATVEKNGSPNASHIFEHVLFYDSQGICILKDTAISDNVLWQEDNSRGDKYTTYMVYILKPSMLSQKD